MAKGSVLRAVELPDPTIESVVATPTRLDIGCGKTTPEGWIGIDSIDFGQKHVWDVRITPWRLIDSSDDPQMRVDGWSAAFTTKLADKEYSDRTWPALSDSSVDEVRSSHFVEHLTGTERIGFFNELWRVMKPDATALIITPNWSHSCAYGDPTHQWPPMSQWWPLYLHRDWRATNAPHVGYTCHFDHVVAGSWDQAIEGRNPETKSMMMNNYTNSWRDLIITLTKRA